MGFNVSLDDLISGNDSNKSSDVPVPQPSAAPSRPSGTQVPTVAPAVDTPVSAPAASSTGVSIGTVRPSGALNLNQMLTDAVKAGASDLHLSVNSHPMMRLNGKMSPIEKAPILTPDNLKATLYRILTDHQIEKFEKDLELDFAHVVEGVARFRGNILQQKGSVGGVFRVIPDEILPLEALGLPPVLYNLSSLPRGLVLVTGPTGSGKSTTLASLIDRANRTRAGHIITIEDPIEFTHTHKKSIINQREVGQDTKSYRDALKHVLRQDPDIILIGELRDLETISTALTAAETGHLVFATLHTQSAQDTVSRIIDVFPESQQQQVRSQLAATLKAVVCQSLVPSADGTKRYPATEIMIVNSAISTLIRRDAAHQIPASLQAGGALGMQTLNMSLAQMVADKKIDRAAAEEYTDDIKDLDTLITGRVADVRKEKNKRSDTPMVPKSGGLSGASL